MLDRLTPRTGVVAALALALPGYGFVAAPADGLEEDFVASSGNVRHVANHTYTDDTGDGENQGSDLEFATIAVPVLDEDDDPSDDDAEDVGTEERTFAFAGSYDNGVQIVDVTDPENTAIVSQYECGISQGDIQLFERDGRHYVAYTMDSGYGAHTKTACFVEAKELGFASALASSSNYGTFIADVTDPYNPATVSFVPVAKGSHNQTVHPSGDYLYNSNSELITTAATAGIEVYDITDFTSPELVTTLSLPPRPGLGTESHDITFNADGDRAYSAALSQTVIIDTSDPTAPSIISSFVDPAINVEHQANPITLVDETTGIEHEFLIVEDEFAGALQTGQCPNGGVHVYDITGHLERAPLKLGYWNIPEARFAPGDLVGLGRCTAHVFELHEEEALMTIAFYNGGVRVVDLSGLVGVAVGNVGVGMEEVAFARFEDSDTWAVKAPYVDRDGSFYIYGNDQIRGMDVYEVDLSSDATTSLPQVKQWFTAAEAYELLGQRELPEDYTPYCLLGEK